MRRRTFLTAAPLALAAPVPALAAPAVGGKTRTLIYVPQENLVSPDPVWTVATMTRNCAGMVFDLLYGRDEHLTARPQMLEGDLVEDNGRRWTMKLREGLWFHDGEKVLARDCVASLRRWMQRDPVGQTINARLDSLEATDDRTLVWRLRKPFAALPYALAKPQNTAAIMPERLALTDPYKQVSEVIGSGPFRFLPDEFVSGSRVAYARFDKYVPRDEPVSFGAGGLRVFLDRVEWRIIPDAATAAAALVTGEVDWLEAPLPDLLPMLRKADGVTVSPVDIYGLLGIMRPNQLHGPTVNPGVRRAMLAAVDQGEEMAAVMGDHTDLFRVPVGVFMPGTPSFTEAGMDTIRKRRSDDEIRAMLREAGYGGERVVVMHPADHVYYGALAAVAIAAFQRVGINLDVQTMDWGTVVQRRTSMEPLDKGGWSIYPTSSPASEYRDPIFAINLRGNGRKANYGWPDDPVIESYRDAWMDSTDPRERRELDAKIQARALEMVPIIPLGQYFPPAAHRNTISGILKGAMPVFWNVTKS